MREMLIIIGEQIENQIYSTVGNEAYGLLIDDVADISNVEQMVIFIQYFDYRNGEVSCKFLSSRNILEKADCANAKALLQGVKEELSRRQLPLCNLKGLATDGAAVMVGVKNGLGALLQEDVPQLIPVHCICHRLALSCVDTCKELQKIKQIEVEITQLWKVFDNSPKKLSVFVKVQEQIKHLQIGDGRRKQVARRLKRTCQTRWLSFGNAIEAFIKDLPAVLQALRELESDSACFGLLKKFSKARFIGSVFILDSVLPILNDLSRTFQAGSVNYARIQPAINSCKNKLNHLITNNTPITKFKDAMQSPILNEISMKDQDITYLKKLLRDYISSLQENIDHRFEQSTPVLNAMQIFNPQIVPGIDSPDIEEYGKKTHKHPGRFLF